MLPSIFFFLVTLAVELVFHGSSLFLTVDDCHYCNPQGFKGIEYK